MKEINDRFEQHCLEAFTFLSEEFRFRVTEVKKDDYGAYLLYENHTTGVKVTLDRMDDRILVTLFRKQNGAIPPYPVFFDPGADVLVFDLNDLLTVRGDANVEPAEDPVYDLNDMRSTIEALSDALHRHGHDVLSGQFGILPQIKDIIARRANG